MKTKLGVKYCGHCNPHIEGSEVIEKLQSLNPDVQFVSYKDEDIKGLIILSACPADCASRPSYQGPTLVIGGYSVDYVPVQPDDFFLEVTKKIKEMI